MRAFEFFSPETVEETLQLLHQYRDSVSLLAGGTDIILELNERKIAPQVVIDLKKVAGLDYIRVDEKYVHIGAMTTHAAIAGHPFIRERVHVLYTACHLVGSPQIQNLGTIGGNIATASVAGDGLCAMVTLQARVVLESVAGVRDMPIDEFLAGEGFDSRNALQADELLKEIYFPVPSKNEVSAFYKLAKRKSLAISVIGGGLLVDVDDEGICRRAVMRGGCLGRYPLPFPDAEQYLVGKKLTLAVMDETLPMLHDRVLEVNKARPWSVFYKKESVKGVFHKLFEDVLSQLSILEKESER